MSCGGQPETHARRQHARVPPAVVVGVVGQHVAEQAVRGVLRFSQGCDSNGSTGGSRSPWSSSASDSSAASGPPIEARPSAISTSVPQAEIRASHAPSGADSPEGVSASARRTPQEPTAPACRSTCPSEDAQPTSEADSTATEAIDARKPNRVLPEILQPKEGGSVAGRLGSCKGRNAGRHASRGGACHGIPRTGAYARCPRSGVGPMLQHGSVGFFLGRATGSFSSSPDTSRPRRRAPGRRRWGPHRRQ